METGKKQLLKSPIMIPVIIFIVLLFILIIYSFSNKNSNEPASSGGYIDGIVSSYITNPDFLYKSETTKQYYDQISSFINTFFSVVYPDIDSLTIDETSLEGSSESFSFRLKTDKTTFSFLLDNNTMSITNKSNETLLSYTFNNIDKATISPHLIYKYLPYNDYLSNGDAFEANLQENKKDVEIIISSCVSKQYESEAIEKTKEYIKLINSDPSFLRYSVKTLCF